MGSTPVRDLPTTRFHKDENVLLFLRHHLVIASVVLSTLISGTAVVASEPDATKPETAPRPLDSGIELDLFSDKIRPGENFYFYANQRWLEESKIPGDKSNYGIFTILDDETRVQVRTLIELASQQTDAPEGSPAQKVGDLYNAVLDLDARNKAGIDPIQPMLDAIGSVNDDGSLVEVAGTLSRAGVNGPFACYVNNDAKDSDQYAVYLTQTGLTMPDRDYYLLDDDRYVAAREAMKRYVADLLTAAGIFDSETGQSDAAAETVLRLETALAKIQWSKTENRDPNKTYNKQSAAELNQTLGAIPIDRYLVASGLTKADHYIVRQDSYFAAIRAATDSFTIEDWKHYYRVRILDAYADSLTESLEKRHFEFHGQTISGIDAQEPLWKRGVNVTGSVLGELVGQLYVEKHFQAEAKSKMDDLVENLKKAFADRIQTRDWMNEGTKKQAIEKLSKFTTKIGYPNQWKNYEALEIQSPVLADNLIAANRFEHNRELDKLGGPIDRSEWHMTPQTINAYYNPVMNEIVFPAAILQPPFFNLDADNAVNYGAIGAVIGHEISHGFDDKGSQYDGDGNLRMWWTPKDREEFERRAADLVKQYSAYEPVEGNFVNGELTLGENIGDLGGLTVAYQAYRMSLGDEEPPVIDGLTGDQRFFLGWSQIWRRLYRGPELLKRLVTDPHSPSEYRVNGIVRNMDAWYDAFEISKDDELYLAPEDRVRIW